MDEEILERGNEMLYGKERYFPAVEFNAVRMINRLAELVREAGGRAEGHSEALYVHTRGYDERIGALRDRVAGAKMYLKVCRPEKKDTAKEALDAFEAELCAVEGRKAKSPVVATQFVSLISDLWIRFSLDGYDYSFETEGNPFFPDEWTKVPSGGEGQCYRSEIEAGDKFYYPDDMFAPVAEEATVEKAAQDLLAFLRGQKAGRRYA